MLRSLVRSKFQDRLWKPDDLDVLARFWLRLYEEADHPPRATRESCQSLEFYLSGFTRSSTVAVSEELSRRFLDAEVSADDPDMLVVRTKPRDGNRLPVSGLGVPALAGVPFDGLMIELRYTVADAGATGPGLNVVGATLVIVGDLRDGAVWVRALWRVPAFVNDDSFWEIPGPPDNHLIAAYTRFRAQDKVDTRYATKLFRSRSAPRSDSMPVRFLTHLAVTPFDRPRFWGLAGRMVGHLGLIASWVGLLILFIEGDWPLLFWLLIVWGIVCWVIVGNFVRVECQLLFSYWASARADGASQYRSNVEFQRCSYHDEHPLHSDPIVRKFTAEATEAGFLLIGDCAAVPADQAGGVYRAFLAPDGATYLAIGFVFTRGGNSSLRVWPASSFVLCQTFDTAGNRFETSDYVNTLAALKREDPTARWASVPKGTHPLDVFAAHKGAVDDWLEEGNRTRQRHVSFEDFVARQNEIAKRERDVYRARPYSWRDHLRWYLQLDAKPEPKR